MIRNAICVLTLTVFAVASTAVPLVMPAKAATEGATSVKKKHKKMHPASGRVQAPATSQVPRNMSEDPDRKAAGGGY